MHFDDRLDTVLRQPVRGLEIARVQYVQLLDLLGKTSAHTASARLDPAYHRLSALGGELPASERARLLRESGLRLRSPALVAFLAEDEAGLARAAVDAADLEEQQWLDLVPALPVRSRGVLRHRRDLGPLVEARLDQLGVSDRGLPPAQVLELDIDAEFESGDVAVFAAPQQTQPPRESPIGELVRKIERYRSQRPAPPAEPASDAPRLPLGDHDLAPAHFIERFDFLTDASGRIARADSDAAPMLVGMLLSSLPFRRMSGAAPNPSDALRLRQPIEAQVVTLEGAAAIRGDWRIDAAPLFDAATGRYTGHAGRARRLPDTAAIPSRASEMADRMRQVLHELRNPAGAIQMGSEFIQQQIGGPVPHEYRALAASIASDTASVLGGLDELDRLVKFDTGAAAVEPGEADLAAVIVATAALLDPPMAQRESGFVLDFSVGELAVAISARDLERLAWRLLAALSGATGLAEKLAVNLSAQGSTARVELALPASLRNLADEELFAAQAKERGPALSAGMFGLGFTLRLAAAEARSAGGSLRRQDDRLVLELPLAQDAAASRHLG
jgi:two-component system OmpR family sensor kinase